MIFDIKSGMIRAIGMTIVLWVVVVYTALKSMEHYDTRQIVGDWGLLVFIFVVMLIIFSVRFEKK